MSGERLGSFLATSEQLSRQGAGASPRPNARGVHRAYPTRAEAVGAVESGAISASADELAKGAWLTAGYQVRLSRVTLDAVRGDRYQGPYKAALLDGVLLLQSDSARDLGETVKRTVMIVAGNEEIIARYLAYPQ